MSMEGRPYYSRRTLFDKETILSGDYSNLQDIVSDDDIKYNNRI